MCPTIAWDENSPPDSESAGLGDDRIRSLKTSLRVGLDGEHVWPSASGDAGVHRLGSARPFYGVQSLVSSSGSDGRLMHTSDTSQLFGVGSGGTSLIGGATVLSCGSFPGTVPQRHYWAVDFGAGVTDSSGSATVTIPNSGYSGIPNVFVTQTNAVIVGSPRIMWVNLKSASAFHVSSVNQSFIGIATNFDWMSIGSRVL